MFLLSLIAALSGTPLRLAEAADDFARAVAELSGDVDFETIDGGVGDDSGETIKGAVADASDVVAPVDAPIMLPDLAWPPARAWIARLVADPPGRPPIGHARRLALTRCFLC